MSVIGTLFFFICLSFFIVIFGVIIFAVYLKNKMTVFKDIRQEEEDYNKDPYVDADFYTIGHPDEPEKIPPRTTPAEDDSVIIPRDEDIL